MDEFVTKLHLEIMLLFIMKSLFDFIIGLITSFLFMMSLVWVCSKYRYAKSHKWLMRVALLVEIVFAFFGFTYDDIQDWKVKRNKKWNKAKKRLRDF